MPVAVTAKSGPAEVLASGILFSFRDEPIEVTFHLQAWEFTLRIVFVSDPSRPGATQEASPVSEHLLELRLFNTGSSLGSGTTKPMPIGTFGGKTLFLHHRVTSLSRGTADKEWHYTVFAANPADLQ